MHETVNLRLGMLVTCLHLILEFKKWRQEDQDFKASLSSLPRKFSRPVLLPETLYQKGQGLEGWLSG